jgi:hypothetical protein
VKDFTPFSLLLPSLHLCKVRNYACQNYTRKSVAKTGQKSRRKRKFQNPKSSFTSAVRPCLPPSLLHPLTVYSCNNIGDKKQDFSTRNNLQSQISDFHTLLDWSVSTHHLKSLFDIKIHTPCIYSKELSKLLLTNAYGHILSKINGGCPDHSFQRRLFSRPPQSINCKGKHTCI